VESSDPYGAGVLFVSQSMAHKFNCHDLVDLLLEMLVETEVPALPNMPLEQAVAPVDHLIRQLDTHPVLFELVNALVEVAAISPPAAPNCQRLLRSAMWLALRVDQATGSASVLKVLESATPGASLRAEEWPRHEFFAAILALTYLGSGDAHGELTALLYAARDLGHHDLAPIVEWYLDYYHHTPI